MSKSSVSINRSEIVKFWDDQRVTALCEAIGLVLGAVIAIGFYWWVFS